MDFSVLDTKPSQNHKSRKKAEKQKHLMTNETLYLVEKRKKLRVNESNQKSIEQ